MWTTHRTGIGGIHFSAILRYEGYRDAMRAAGLTELVTTTFEPNEMAAELKDIEPTALITFTTQDNVYVYNTLLYLGWRIPGNLSLASLDMEKRLEHPVAQPGGMIYDRYEIGRQAGEMLFKRLEDGVDSVPTVRFGAEFTLGDTILPRKS